VHGRYLSVVRGQNKMLTIGPGNGMIAVLGGWRAEPLILVEGLFDVLSLATCGFSCAATIGRWAQWLPEVTAGRVVWLAFDASKSGEADAARFAGLLRGAEIRRLPPPPPCLNPRPSTPPSTSFNGWISTHWGRARTSKRPAGH